MIARDEPLHMSATTARAKFGELMDAVADRGETIIIEKKGKPLAAVVPIGEYRRLTRCVLDQNWWDRQREIAEELERNLAGRPRLDAKGLINAGRE